MPVEKRHQFLCEIVFLSLAGLAHVCMGDILHPVLCLRRRWRRAGRPAGLVPWLELRWLSFRNFFVSTMGDSDHDWRFKKSNLRRTHG